MSNQKLYELSNIIGEDNVSRISILDITPYDMQSSELEILINLMNVMKLRKQKGVLTSDKNCLKQISSIVEEENISSIKVFNITPERMDKEEQLLIIKLLNTMKLREKGYKIVQERWETEGDWIKVTFDYHRTIVQMVSSIPSSYYKYEEKIWMVHISDWPLVEEIFRVTQLDLEEKYKEWKKLNKINRLKITDEGCFLTGEDLPKDKIHFITSFPVKDAQHTPSFKNGNWDGRTALYNKYTGFFPYGLINKVLIVLRENKVEFEFTDERHKPNKKYNWEKNVRLRDYQEIVKQKALDQGRGILQLATGAGKTKTASAIISEYGLDSVFFVHTKFLLGQAKEALKEVLNIHIGQVGDGIVDIQPVTVAMIQTTIKALGGEYVPSEDDEETDASQIEDTTDITGKETLIYEMLKKAGIVFFDECQFVAAESFYTIANFCNAYYKYGLSATPYRSDKKDLMIEAALGPVISRVTASYLIKRGFLTKPLIHYIKIGNFNRNDSRKYQTVYREDIVENNYRNSKIVECAKRLSSKYRSSLILVQQVLHGEILKQMFKQQGLEVEFVSGNDDTDKRNREIFKLRTKKSLVLIATTIADEGLDVPSLDGVILGGGGKSPSKSMQRVGRAIRVFGEKEEAHELFLSTQSLLSENKNVLIIVDNIEHGNFIKSHFEKEDKSKTKLDIDFYYGEDFHKNKNKILKSFAKKEIKCMILCSTDITSEEISKINPINALLISEGDNFDIETVNRIPKNIEIKQSLEDVIYIYNNLRQKDKTILILVDESKTGNKIKEEFNKLGIKAKFLTGIKNTENIEDKIDKLVLTNKSVLILNSSYIKNAIDNLKDIDKIILYEENQIPYTAIDKTQLDLRIFKKKEEAYVIDFQDCSKYLYDHSIERKKMFETETEFKITGWK